MASRVTLKSVNSELARQGYIARLAKAGGYFYFQFGEAADWLDRTVHASTIGSHSVEGWIAEFHRLRKLNAELMGKAASKKPARKRAAQPQRPT